jgi:hypothetical protein
MFEEKLYRYNKDDIELKENDVECEYGALQMKIFMDYCYFIEKLWLDWKQYYLRFLH